ncbi:putative membrane protein [Parapusillimonas granuli]|nr:putative membrane protein [Parapusillimonas granuli]
MTGNFFFVPGSVTSDSAESTCSGFKLISIGPCVKIASSLKNSGLRELFSPKGVYVNKMNTFNQIIRGVLFFVLAIFGMIMAFVFMVSTAIAVAILYVVARVKGRPFGVRAYWEERRRPAGGKAAFNTKDVTDVEMREIP